MKENREIWIDALDFDTRGGWKEDTQFVHLMGGGYLIAADEPGVPVPDACVTAKIEQAGRYRVWVRDRNWLRPHNPGIFSLLVNGQDNGKVLGTMPSDGWIWEIAGDFDLEEGETRLALHDLSGYFGRCAAILITNDFDYVPPREVERIHAERARIKGLPTGIKSGGDYDVIVAGGGPGGVPAALAAARMGARTLLLQNRPVLGGNASREVGITSEGASASYPYSREGGIAEEIRRLRDREEHFTGDWSRVMARLTEQEENLTVAFNSHVCAVEMESPSVIRGVTVLNFRDLSKTRYTGKMFIDCTGDAWMGYYAGAKYRLGREGQDQHNEDLAPELPDTQTMSGCIRADHIPLMCRGEEDVEYHAPEWVPKLPDYPDKFGRKIPYPGTRMAWWIEAPNTYDDIWDGEESRDALFLVILGYYDLLKNKWEHHDLAKKLRFRFNSIFNGRRESRRLIGDYIMTQADCLEGRRFDDGISYTGWHIDIHHPEGIYSGLKGPLYCSREAPKPHVPFRCLYSVNIDNLMMAGRNISVSHIALGTTRVQNTIATLGQAAGTAAAMCIRYGETPREIYQRRMQQLQQQLIKDDQHIPGLKNEDPNDPCLRAAATASSVRTDELFMERAGIPGPLVPLDRPRLVTLGVFGGKPVDGIWVKLTSERAEPYTITAHARSAGHDIDTDPTRSEEVSTVTAQVPPMGESWVKLPFSMVLEQSKYVERCTVQLWLDPAEGISWRSILDLNMYSHYGEQTDSGEWVIKSGKSYFVRASEPNEKMANCGPANTINGHGRIIDAERYEWVSDPAQALPQWLKVDFEAPTRINTVRLAFDTDLTNPCTCWSRKNPNPPQCVKAYTLEVFDGAQWTAVADVDGNFQRRRIHQFPEMTAHALRVTVSQTWGDPSARIMEIRAGLEN